MATARSSLEERLAKVREREARLKRERDRLVARLSTEERKRDTRRKILLGSLVLAKLEESPKLREFIARELSGFLTRVEDRALFDGIVELAVDEAAENPALPETEAGAPELG